MADKAPVAANSGDDDIFTYKPPNSRPNKPCGSKFKLNAASIASPTLRNRYVPAFVPRWPAAAASSSSLEVAESITVWLPREIRDGFLVGDADDLVATAATATFSELLPANPVSAQALPDMSNLLHLEKQHVLHNLKQRFDWKLIHTFVGGMLVICNPYALLPHMYAKPVRKYNPNQLLPSLFFLPSPLPHVTVRARYTPAMMRQYHSASLKQLETRQLAPHISWAAALACGAIVATQAISLFIIAIRCIPSARIAGQTRMQVPRRRRVE